MSTQTAERTEELLLYVAERSQDDPAFGAIKLNKILFMIDFWAYGLWGHPLTIFKHIRQRLGPTPAPGQFLPMRKHLIDTGRAGIATATYFGKEQERLVALVPSRMQEFDPDEQKLIDDVISSFRGANASDLTSWTHGLIPWLATKNGDELPFYTVFTMKKRPADKASIEWAEAIARDIVDERAND